MRTLGIILVTATITFLVTSAAWVLLYNLADRDEEIEEPADRSPPVPRSAPTTAPMPDDDADIVYMPDVASPSDLMAKEFVLPVRGFDAADLVPQFDDGRGGGRLHEAIDLMAPRGTPVVAVEDGIVAKLFESERGGLTIYQFDPTETFVYYYAHLDRYAPGMEEGDMVKQGQLIGYVGSTGNAAADAPHLHFAIQRLGPEKNWWQAKAVDPYPVLSAGG